jgi:hypothetical protein
MPAIIFSEISYSDGLFYIDLSALAERFPNIITVKTAKTLIIELRDERNLLVQRFKPFYPLTLDLDIRWRSPSEHIVKLVITPSLAFHLNIGVLYRLLFCVTSIDGKPFLPFELKPIGIGSERVKEYLSQVEIKFLSLVLEQSELSEAYSYLWDAFSRLEANDVEGAKTSIRKALIDTIKYEFLPKVKVLQESKEFPKKIGNLLKALSGFVQYGGPHKGPALRTTTEMALFMSLELLEFLARAINENIIMI